MTAIARGRAVPDSSANDGPLENRTPPCPASPSWPSCLRGESPRTRRRHPRTVTTSSTLVGSQESTTTEPTLSSGTHGGEGRGEEAPWRAVPDSCTDIGPLEDRPPLFAASPSWPLCLCGESPEHDVVIPGPPLMTSTSRQHSRTLPHEFSSHSSRSGIESAK